MDEPLPPQGPISARFREMAPLGEGAFGRVYAATDGSGRAVAVKTMTEAAARRPEAVWQFTSELRRLRRLSHPAFPAAYEEGRTEDGRPFYAMELVSGPPLPAGPHGAGVVRRWLGELADALAYLHGLGWVHGDLKPENLRQDADGRLRILDVGLMAPIGRKREDVSGSLAYLAPEVLRKATVAPAADLYALGCVAYELWHGHPPFAGSASELVRAQLQQPPRITASGDPALAELLARMLAKAPESRPASMASVLAALAGEPETGAPPAMLAGGDFVGREAVLACWKALLAEPAPGWLWLAGGPGAGKTRTLEELRLHAQMAGRLWVGAACADGAEAPGSSLRSVVGQAIAATGVTPAPACAAWLVGGVPAELTDLEPAARKLALHAAVARTLAAAAAACGGLAVGIDDLQRADDASQETLHFLERALEGAPVTWVLATTAEPAPEEALILAPFSPAELRLHVTHRLGLAPDEELVSQLAAASQGNPQMLDLVLEHLVATGALQRDQAGWRLASGQGRAGVPATLATAFAARWEGLPDATRTLAAVTAVAAAAGDWPAPTLAAAAGLADDELATALDALLARGVLVESGGRVRLASYATRDFLLDFATPGERSRWATALARNVAGASPEALPLDDAVRAATLALAGDDPALAYVLAARAGRLGLELGAAAAAHTLFAAACERMPGVAAPAEQLAAMLPRADAERLLDRLGDAAVSYTRSLRLAREAGDEAAAARAGVGLAKTRQLQADYDGAFAALDEAERAARAAGDAAQEARVTLARARLKLFRGRTVEAVTACERTITIAEGVAPVVRGQALNLLAALVVQGDPARGHQARSLAREALAISEGLGDGVGVGQALENLGNVHLALGELGEAAACFARAVANGRSLGLETEALGAAFNEALVAAELGESERARTLAIATHERALRAGRKFIVAASATVLAQAAWRAARPLEVREPLEEALALAREIGNVYLEEHVRLARLETALGVGRTADARAEAMALAPLVERTGHAEAAARLALARAELALTDGQLEEARGLARAQVGSVALTTAHRAHQILADVEGAAGRAEAVTHARAALAIAERWSAPWHLAADQLRLAVALERQGQRADALCAAESAASHTANPLARAAALRLVARLGARADDARLLADAVQLLRPGLTPLPADERQALLAAYGLDELAPALVEAAVTAGGGSCLNARDFAAYVEALALEPDEAGVSRLALDAAMTLVDAERGYMLSYENGRLRQAVTLDVDFATEVEAGFSNSIAEQALFSGQPVYVVDAATDATWSQAASVMALGLRTVICVPLGVATGILGVLYLDRTRIEPVLGEADVALLGAFGTCVATAIAERRARQEAERWRWCAELGARMARDHGPAARTLLALAMEAVGADRAFWLLSDEQGWRTLASVGAEVAPDGISRGIASWVLERTESLSVWDTDASAEWQSRQSVQALGMRTIWCVPALVPGQVLYLDAARAVEADPAPALRLLEQLVQFAGPLLPLGEQSA